MSGIATVYRKTRFRSRLEATWAAFFDQIGWSWIYEPYDLPGWIPDFLVKFDRRSILVEVKPAENPADAANFVESAMIKAKRGVLIVGLSPVMHENERHYEIGAFVRKESGRARIVDAYLVSCSDCWKTSLRHEGGGVTGEISDCVCFDPVAPNISTDGGLEDRWAHAKNATQWFPS